MPFVSVGVPNVARASTIYGRLCGRLLFYPVGIGTEDIVFVESFDAGNLVGVGSAHVFDQIGIPFRRCFGDKDRFFVFTPLPFPLIGRQTRDSIDTGRESLIDEFISEPSGCRSRRREIRRRHASMNVPPPKEGSCYSYGEKEPLISHS